MQSTTEQDIQKSIAASDMYQLLAIALQLPTQELAEGVLSGSLAEDVLSIYQELGFSNETIEKTGTKFAEIKNSNITKEELLTELRQEYTRLFTHPKKSEIEIYETLFRYVPEEGEGKPSLFISPAALDAERCYKKADLVRAKEVNEPGDHMATEMEFMMFLYLEKAKALQEDNQEQVARRAAQIKEFNELHLQRWAKPFFEKMTAVSHSTFYRIIGEMGSAFVTEIVTES
ncbi:dehydrogenase [Desulfitobacterium hafniense]|uniref:Dehydrogenase n=1 Tax=Desulfitobacterium hafniense TaxID=49338 RepID=A0A0W1JKT5_DESHA|nr:molecular chaperone TorD family protein [Desulfitobacterium hafniense]KTE92433.1 dehydrogenase [Desulfitobacterium hafniense]